MQNRHSNLIFISNELIDPDLYKKLNIPLEFITFAHTDGEMYSHFKNNGVFFLPHNWGIRKSWGNTKVYVAVFLLKDYFFYVDLLDAYHACSKNKLTYNHINDIHHRVQVSVTPIKFNTIDELSSLRYREGQEVDVVSYVGNTKHPKIKQRLTTQNNYREVNGCYELGIRKLFREVLHE